MIMTTQERMSLVGGLVLAFGLVGCLAFIAESCQKKHGNANEVTAHIAEGEANAHQSQANASDAKVSDLQAKVDGQAKELGRLNAERDALLKRLAAKPVPHADPVGSNLSPTDLVDALETAVADRDEVIAKDAEVIGKLEADSTVKDSLIVALTTSRDEWKATAQARERQAIAQAAATEAWKKAVSSSKWTGRVQGFAAGVALGYVGGRR
jgi:hypothetical protein